ncbi:hypothetical protein DUI87_29878 [Hirundo rustica rustica]|uniref:Uncharacterized protein n=1 Tax=Hirundo rustica rustica TaxID=333673 RepID=A0A3M0IWI7_HIRRU|nr:hypothetical protein DUI87_29878 [Hirundo rustica rustica]
MCPPLAFGESDRIMLTTGPLQVPPGAEIYSVGGFDTPGYDKAGTADPGLKETNPQLTTATLQEAVESDKVTSESPFLQAKQPQFPQSFFIQLMLQAPHQPRCPPLDSLKHLNILPKLKGPELDTILKVWPHQCRVQGKNNLPAPAGHTIPDTGQYAIGPLGHQGTLLAHVQLVVDQNPQVPFFLGTVQPHRPQPITLQGVIVAKVQDSALGLIKPHPIGLCPSVQPFQF